MPKYAKTSTIFMELSRLKLLHFCISQNLKLNQELLVYKMTCRINTYIKRVLPL